MARTLGAEFAAAHAVLDENATERLSIEAFCSMGTDRCDRWGWHDYYVLPYRISFAGPSGDERAVNVTVTPDGRIVDEDLRGLPDCGAMPAECTFSLTAEDAVRLAREAGLGEDARPWEVALVSHQAYQWPRALDGGSAIVWGTYAWRVQNATGEDPHEGLILVFDANDGRLLLRDRWFKAVWWG